MTGCWVLIYNVFFSARSAPVPGFFSLKLKVSSTGKIPVQGFFRSNSKSPVPEEFFAQTQSLQYRENVVKTQSLQYMENVVKTQSPVQGKYRKNSKSPEQGNVVKTQSLQYRAPQTGAKKRSCSHPKAKKEKNDECEK